MQEEVTRGAVMLIVDGAKLSEQVFEKAIKKFLEEIQKSQKPKIYRGRAAPLPGLFQKPGCGCHHSGISGVCQPENKP